MEGKYIILVSGLEGSGKDTFAIFARKFGFERLAFADELKLQCSKKYDLPLYLFHDRSEKDSPILSKPYANSHENRTCLQINDMYKFLKTKDGKSASTTEDLTFTDNVLLGEDTLYHTPRTICILEGCVSRCVEPNIWIRYVSEHIKERNLKRVVITDRRFYNEWVLTKKVFEGEYKIVRVLITEKKLNEKYDNDYVIFNEKKKTHGSLKEYEEKVTDCINSFI